MSVLINRPFVDDVSDNLRQVRDRLDDAEKGRNESLVKSLIVAAFGNSDHMREDEQQKPCRK